MVTTFIGHAMTHAGTRRRTRAGARTPALVALSAYGGAIGLVTGDARPGSTINARLPFDSPVFAAFALTVFVALPTTAVACVHVARRPARGPAAEVAGVLLIGWIAVELAFIRELSLASIRSTSSSARRSS